MSYAEFLRKSRESVGLSQGKLADAITSRGHRTTTSSISNIERRQYVRQDGSEMQPHRNLVVLAAEVTGSDVNEALLAAGYAPTNITPDNTHDILQEARISFMANSSLTDEEKAEIIKVATRLVAGMKAEQELD